LYLGEVDLITFSHICLDTIERGLFRKSQSLNDCCIRCPEQFEHYAEDVLLGHGAV
jgi:hypothetical protein